MKRLSLVLALVFFAVLPQFARADVEAIKAALDAPVVVRFVFKQGPQADAGKQRAEFAKIFGVSVREVEQARGARTTLREFFALAGKIEGSTAASSRMLGRTVKGNADAVGALIPLLEKSNPGLAADLKQTLERVGKDELLDRAGQDTLRALCFFAP